MNAPTTDETITVTVPVGGVRPRDLIAVGGRVMRVETARPVAHGVRICTTCGCILALTRGAVTVRRPAGGSR